MQNTFSDVIRQRSQNFLTQCDFIWSEASL